MCNECPTFPSGLPSRFGRPATVVLADDEWMFRASLRQLLTAPPSVIKDVYGVETGYGFNVIGEAGSGEETVSLVESARPDLLLLALDLPRMSGLDVLRAIHMNRGSAHGPAVAERAPSAPLRSTADALCAPVATPRLQGEENSLDAPSDGPAGATPRIIVLAGTIRKSDLFQAVQLGIHGVILKDAPTEVLFAAISSVLLGRRWLDQRLVSDLMEMVKAFAAAPNAASPRRPFGLTRRELEVLGLVVAGYPNKEIARACAVSEQTVKHHLTRMFDKVGASNRLELALIATESGVISESASAAFPGPA